MPFDDLQQLPKLFENSGNVLFCHLNIRSLVSKFDELQVIIEGCKGLVLGIIETWLNEGVSDAEVKIQGFRMYRRDRGTRGGGVLVYVCH